MKKFLKTWYGMTDFRASIGLATTTGPVLEALVAEDYTDVIIQGFTRQDKTEHKSEEFQREIASVQRFSEEVARHFIENFSNTESAHTHFIEWLKKQLMQSDGDIPALNAKVPQIYAPFCYVFKNLPLR